MHAIYNHTHSRHTRCPYGTYCCSHSTVTIHATCTVTSHDKRFALYISTFSSSVQRPVWLFSVAPCVEHSRYVQVLRERIWEGSTCPYHDWYHFCFYAALTLHGFYILIPFRVPSPSNIFFLKFQFLLTDMFLVLYHALWCPVYLYGWFCQF